MARAAIALSPKDSLPQFVDGVELVYVSGGLAFLPEAGNEEHVHFLTVLVNLSHDPVQRRVVNAVGFALVGLHFAREVLSGRDWEQVLKEKLLALPPGRVNVILLLPRVDATASKTALRALAAIQDDTIHTFGAVVAVAESPISWRELKTVDGFVKSTSASLPYDATAMLALLATFMAPTMLTCSDESDLADSLGDYVRPSTIALPMWNSESRTLHFLTSRDRQAVASAEAVSLSPLWFDGTWSDSHELMKQIRDVIPANADYFYNVSTEFFSSSHWVAGGICSPVVVLCRPLLATAQ